jgi:hypothetical protein
MIVEVSPPVRMLPIALSKSRLDKHPLGWISSIIEIIRMPESHCDFDAVKPSWYAFAEFLISPRRL